MSTVGGNTRLVIDEVICEIVDFVKVSVRFFESYPYFNGAMSQFQ